MPDQTTFIPKTSPVKIPYSGRGLGLFTGLASVFFILSLLLSFGLFFYRGLLQTQIDELGATLAKVENEFEPASILELQQTAKGITEAKLLLKKHVALSQLFKFLSANTIADVRFLNFSYQDAKVDMNGVAKSYSSMAQESLILESSRLVKNVNFSNFSLTQEGFVNFNVKFAVTPDLISYQTPSR